MDTVGKNQIELFDLDCESKKNMRPMIRMKLPIMIDYFPIIPNITCIFVVITFGTVVSICV